MASQFAASAQQTQQSPLLQQAYNGGATASVYGPALSRTRASDAESIAQARAEYDAHMAALDAQRDAANRSALAAEWERTNGQVARPPAFYNTKQGDELIAAARQDLARSKPAAAGAASASINGAAHLTSVHDNRQRIFHNDCVVAQNIALDAPTTRAAFQQFPLQEFNRFNLEARTWSGPEIHSRLKSVPYTSPKGPKQLDVQKRHDMIPNLAKNKSISNYNHGKPFLAKHTNNLISS